LRHADEDEIEKMRRWGRREKERRVKSEE